MTSQALDHDPVVLLSDVARLARTLADGWARTHGMTRAQWMVLVWVERHSGISQNELASLIDVEPITVARLIDRLEDQGLVERRPDATDRRIKRLHVMQAARPMLKVIGKARGELNAILATGLVQKDLDIAIACLQRMKMNVSERLREQKSS